jgi:two-component system, NtrC family, response regulator HydG
MIGILSDNSCYGLQTVGIAVADPAESSPSLTAAKTGSIMRARLTVESGECTPRELDLVPGQPATLGRSRDNSLILRDDLASRMHAKVYFEDGRWVVRDFGLNGTKVSGSRISGSMALADGSVIQVGETALRFAMLSTSEADSRTVLNSPAITPTHFNGQFANAMTRKAETLPGTASDTRKSSAVSVPVDRRTPAETGTRKVSAAEALGVDNTSKLKVDELTALCRFMTAAMEATDAQELIRLALRSILFQTAARITGYLNLDPSDPTPRQILPEQANVDTQLSRHLTERVRSSRRIVWLHGDNSHFQEPKSASDSLSAFRDAICLPLSSHGETYAALHVYRTGAAFDERDVRFVEAVGGYLSRSLDLHRHRRKLEAENQRLRLASPTADELIGDSTAMITLRQQISRAAPQPFTVVIQGESGSGKELVAQALHRSSLRTAGPLVVVNCAAIAPSLLEAELFGHKKGAFSGADRDRPGLFEQADEGTLFLDEVGELSLECQAKLLRVIEGKPFRPVGGTADVKVDVRVIAATNRDLEKDVKAGRFRQDLLFRLKVITLIVPSLRDHAEDIPELARFFLERLSVTCRRPLKLTTAAMRALAAYAWPGNVRQLRAVLETAAVMSETDTIDANDLPLTGTQIEPVAVADLPPSLDIDDLETWAICKALKQTHGNVSKAAQVLGMSRDTLHTKLKKKAIDREVLLAEIAD